MTQPIEPVLARRNSTTVWVSYTIHQQLIRLRLPDETLGGLIARLIDHYQDTVLLQSHQEVP